MRMKKIVFFIFILFISIQFEISFADHDVTLDRKKEEVSVVIDAPISIKIDHGNLLLDGANNRSVIIKGPLSFNIKTDIDWKIYMPIIAALITTIVAFISGLFLSWRNHIHIKQQKWYNSWSEKLLNLNDQLFDLANGAMFNHVEYTHHKIEVAMTKIKLQVCSYTKNSKQLQTLFGELEIKLKSSNAFEIKDEIFSNIGIIIQILFKEIRNG